MFTVEGMSNVKERKICVMGYSRVGKSSLTIRFVNNHFPDSYEPTISSTFTKSFEYNKVNYSVQVCYYSTHKNKWNFYRPAH